MGVFGEITGESSWLIPDTGISSQLNYDLADVQVFTISVWSIDYQFVQLPYLTGVMSEPKNDRANDRPLLTLKFR